MRSYKLVLVLKTSLSDSARKKILDTLKDWLKGLKVLKEKELGQKPLSYSIKKEVAGFYVEVNFEGENVPVDLEKKIKTSEDILRHLLLRQN